MYYYRDSYLDDQIAFVARSSYTRPKRRESTATRVWKDLTQITLSFICMIVTFALGYMVLDVLGLEHLVQLPKLESVVHLIGVFNPVDAIA